MRVLVCGGRDFDDYPRVEAFLSAQHKATPFSCLIQGGARGADALALHWAMVNKVPCEQYRPDWATYGLRAGSVRNQQMLDEGKPDLVIAFPGGAGTFDMVRKAKKAKVETLLVGATL